MRLCLQIKESLPDMSSRSPDAWRIQSTKEGLASGPLKPLLDSQEMGALMPVAGHATGEFKGELKLDGEEQQHFETAKNLFIIEARNKRAKVCRFTALIVHQTVQSDKDVTH